MARPCKVCGHVNRGQIELQSVQGASLRSIAGQNGVSKSALMRHLSNHLQPRLAAAQAGEPLPHVDPAPSLAALIEARHLGRLREDSSIRDHAVMDMERLEVLLASAVAAGNGAAMLAVLRTKWAVAERAGLTVHIDRPIRLGAEGNANPVVAAIAKQDRLRQIMLAAATKFTQLAGLNLETEA